MERTIKFRGKRTDNGEWVYGMPTYDFMYVFSEEQLDSVDNYRVDAETIGQFTGLKDKNGVEIYEYDIATLGKNPKVIKYFPKYGMFGFVGKSVYRQFDESEPMGSGGSSTRYKPYVLSEYYQKRMEIIGNIHDNPELINEIKK